LSVGVAAPGVFVAAGAFVAVAAAVEVTAGLVAVAAPALAAAVAVLSALLFPPPHPAAKTAPMSATMAIVARYPQFRRGVRFMVPSLRYAPIPGAAITT
jgi:hypothetical protein